MVDAIRVVARGDALLDLAVTRALAERISRFGPSRYWFCSPGGSPTPRPLNDEQEQGSSVLLFDGCGGDAGADRALADARFRR